MKIQSCRILLVAFIPLIVTIILINVKINGQVICQLETGVLAGSVLALIMMWKYQDPSKLLGHVGDTCKSSLNAICNTSAVVAFGGVVKLAPAFAAVVNAMLNIPGPKILSLAIATTVLAGICGSGIRWLWYCISAVRTCICQYGYSGRCCCQNNFYFFSGSGFTAA